MHHQTTAGSLCNDPSYSKTSVRLLERLLNLVTQPGDLVVDPFAGSCSTAKACVNTGRKYICFEKDREYYQSGMDSLNTHSRQGNLF
ncbi:MAG: DNA methyltransferase [Alistipes indistinctus]